MNRPRWFPEIHPDTDEDAALAMRQCQGDWWQMGSPICRKPEFCIIQRACYFVAQAAVHEFPQFGICWAAGTDDWWEREAA